LQQKGKPDTKKQEQKKEVQVIEQVDDFMGNLLQLVMNTTLYF
jgi:hypothetical protein